MLHHITEDGHLHWKCPYCPEDAPHNTAHISHEEVRYSEFDSTHIILPKCACGAQTGINTIFTEQELLPPIIHRGMLPTVPPREGIVSVERPGSHNFTIIREHLERYIVNGEERIVRVIDSVEPSPSRQAVPHHQELARQLETIGKHHTHS